MKTLEITKKTVLDCITFSQIARMLAFEWKIPVAPQAIDIIEQHSSELGITVLPIEEGEKGVKINMPIQGDKSLQELYLLVDKLIAIVSCMFDTHNLVVNHYIEYHNIISRLNGIAKDFEHNEPAEETNTESTATPPEEIYS